MTSSATGEILWQPSPERVAETQLTRFAEAHGFAPTDFPSLHAWSVREPEAYYTALWDLFGIVGTRGDTIVAPDRDLRKVRFFPEARLNYAENLLRSADDRVAIIAHREDGTRRQVSRRQLATLVSRCVHALQMDGVGPGDRIAAIVTNDIEAIALYLASAAIGAIWTSCSPDFGPSGATDRLGQVSPAILVAVASYGYAGKRIDTTASINAVAQATGVRRIVLLGDLPATASHVVGAMAFETWIAPHQASPIAFRRSAFNTPLAILYSSGTTGAPKGIVHSAGGLLLQHLKEHRLHADIREGNALFYYTTCGWMMWNWLVSGLASGATLVTYDGNPSYPHPSRLVDLIDAEKIDVFGVSAKFIDACGKAGLSPMTTHSLASLRTILSTGSPLLPASYDYIYRNWKRDVHLASISGGTDICGCFLGGVPNLPVRRGELQGKMLGMDVATLRADGETVEGEPGELVCRNAHPSMPLGFWNDDDGSRYHAAYFGRFANVWTHGDFVEIDPISGGSVVQGRSDTTLNPGGVRIGTAEIYRIVERFHEVEESVAVAQAWSGDQRIVLFVKLRQGVNLSRDLEARLRHELRAQATPRHVPARIITVSAIPRTRSGKISESAIRDTIHGRPISNDTALANPECLALYEDIAALKT